MIAHLFIGAQRVAIDLGAPHDLAIPLDFDGPQPRAFGLERATQHPFTAEGFIASVRQGGAINCMQLTLWPHGNGTHTETVGHLLHDPPPIGTLRQTVHPATLLTVAPTPLGDSPDEHYPEPGAAHDRVITARALHAALDALDVAPDVWLTALVVRTLAPGSDPRAIDHTGQNPPYLTTEAMRWVRARGVQHLLLDLPSVDRELDQGKLSNHRIFWDVAPGSTTLAADHPARERTITELIWARDFLSDGRYILDLHIPPLLTDAAPSRPRLFVPLSIEHIV